MIPFGGGVQEGTLELHFNPLYSLSYWWTTSHGSMNGNLFATIHVYHLSQSRVYYVVDGRYYYYCNTRECVLSIFGFPFRFGGSGLGDNVSGWVLSGYGTIVHLYSELTTTDCWLDQLTCSVQGYILQDKQIIFTAMTNVQKFIRLDTVVKGV